MNNDMADDFFDTASKTYVRFVLDELKLTPSALAKGAGIASTTLTRALNDPEHKFTLSMKTLGKIASFSGISPNPFFESKDFAEMSMAPFERADLYDNSWSSPHANLSPAEGHVTIVIGHASAGIWKVPELLQLERHAPLWITMPKVNSTDLFALLVDDDSAAPYVCKGEYALCRRLRALTIGINHGDLLAIERWRDNNALMEITLRRLVLPPDDKPGFLRFDGDGFDERLAYDPQTENQDGYKVLGAVEWALRSTTDYALRSEMLRRRNQKRIM